MSNLFYYVMPSRFLYLFSVTHRITGTVTETSFSRQTADIVKDRVSVTDVLGVLYMISFRVKRHSGVLPYIFCICIILTEFLPVELLHFQLQIKFKWPIAITLFSVKWASQISCVNLIYHSFYMKKGHFCCKPTSEYDSFACIQFYRHSSLLKA